MAILLYTDIKILGPPQPKMDNYVIHRYKQKMKINKKKEALKKGLANMQSHKQHSIHKHAYKMTITCKDDT